MKYDYLIVGAGLFGSVLAERIADTTNSPVLVIDKRQHIGGNCYSETDAETGIELHKYGTHIFHTSSRQVWNYITKFTEFNGYHHQVLTTYRNKVYQMPINLETINSFYNLNLRPYEAKEFLKKEIQKEKIHNPKNLEEKAISLIGRPLYEAFIKGYTVKHWGRDPKELPPDIIARLPVRFNYREDYFLDARWQGIPVHGYTKVFERLLSSPQIDIQLNWDYFKNRNEITVRKKTIYTGPIDQYFDYEFGRLGWRSVIFKKKIINVEDFQGTSVMNYADLDIDYTRIHEPKHLHPERKYNSDSTVIFYETSKCDSNEPYYPVNNEVSRDRFLAYKKLAQKEKNVVIGGRLGDYAYYDMDKTILAALKCFEEKIIENR